MNAFIDPRADPDPDRNRASARLTEDRDDLEKLRQLCREGRLYEVERWIEAGRPLQLPQGRPPGRSRWQSPLEIALEDGNHALIRLLLTNGYDPNREYRFPLDLALRARRWDLLDLLLDWGADPNQVDLGDLFDTYQIDLFERFRELGVNLTAAHEMATTLAHHTSNKPLFGFAKRHRKDNPEIQRELDIALGYHARKGNEKGVSLCLWAGADPHVRAPDLHYDDDESRGVSAVYAACSWGQVDVLKQLGPNPDQDDFDDLYRAADTGAVVDFLAEIALPEDDDTIIRRHLCYATMDWGFNIRSRRWRAINALERLFAVGLRWEESSKEDIRRVRGCLLRAPDDTLIDVMKLLATQDYCSPKVLHELGRTSAIRRRMKEVGFIPPNSDNRSRSKRSSRRPTRSREVRKKFGIETSQGSKRKQSSMQSESERSIPRTVRIGRKRPDSRKIEMDRSELFERVWSEPVYQLAEAWGLSGTGLRKVCKRVEIPTPGRGYWQKLKAGKRVSRPELPELPEDQAKEIIVWVPE